MDRLFKGIAQGAVVFLVALAAALVFNAVSVNGIDPFRKIAEVPVVEDDTGGEAEGVQFIGLERFRSILDSGKIVLDARTADEYAAGHIPGAILFDYYEFGKYSDKVLPMLDPSGEFAVYCTGINCEDSELLAKELYTMGYTRVLVYREGFEGWQKAGLPVEKGL